MWHIDDLYIHLIFLLSVFYSKHSHYSFAAILVKRTIQNMNLHYEN